MGNEILCESVTHVLPRLRFTGDAVKCELTYTNSSSMALLRSSPPQYYIVDTKRLFSS